MTSRKRRFLFGRGGHAMATLRMLPLLFLLAGPLAAQTPGAELRIRTTGGEQGQSWNLWANGHVGDWYAADRAGRVRVTLELAGQPAGGVWPRCELHVGSRWVADFSVVGERYRALRFEARVGSGPFPVLLGFTNDRRTRTEDRNLLVRSVRVEGARRMARAPTLAQWTDAWIASHRMATLEVRAAPGARVAVRQLRAGFPFGTALAGRMLAADADRRYRQLVARNFNAAVFENAMKWRQSEREAGEPDWTVVDRMLAFCQRQGLLVRGHCIFWADPRRVPAWAKKLDAAGLRTAVVRRARLLCERYRGRVAEYDVNNEMVHHGWFRERLGPEVRVEMFRLARRFAPKARLFVNDYGVLGGGALAAYDRQIEKLLAAGAPLGGIGCQGHFRRLPGWIRILTALNRLARHRLPIAITEYDLDTADEQVRAEGLERFYRLCYAHPAVSGIWMWGFWEGAHWRPRAALWRRDFSPTAAARRYRQLRYQRWWTDAQATADQRGVARLRVFAGRHQVTAGDRKVEAVVRAGATARVSCDR